MYYYRIADITLQSYLQFPDFEVFACPPADADIILEATNDTPPSGDEVCSSLVASYRSIPGGWFFHPINDNQGGLFVSTDYSRLRLYSGSPNDYLSDWMILWLIRGALESKLALHGFVAMHAAAVELNGEAFLFSGPSGIGKSTWAKAWEASFGAKLISGDRSLIDVKNMEIYGIPWDGEEQCFRNVHYPLNSICEVRHLENAYVRAMTTKQRLKLLTARCFMPGWDKKTMVVQKQNIIHLATHAKIVRAFCGPSTNDARVLQRILEENHCLPDQPEIYAKAGFVLRKTPNGYLLMPKRDHTVLDHCLLLNDVSSLIWNSLQNPVSKDDLINVIQSEYDVCRDVAEADLNAFLSVLQNNNIICIE